MKNAEENGSTDKNLYMNLGIALMNILGQTDAALCYFEKAKYFDPDILSFTAYFDPQGY
ncbi:hypothetical protein H7F33_09855 [Pedobacter sp. PAMC26386]|nr:hypothetical protein H7F33_09855 [Pedobacter sp. PAMC26386]